MSPLLIPPSSTGPENAQQHSIRVQVLLTMEQDRLYKEEARDLLDQRLHVVTTNQDLQNSTRNFVWLAGYYLRTDKPIR